MKPFYQGKIDVFCAIYAVLNGLKITHNIRSSQARGILHQTLMALSHNPRVLLTVLEQKTDYIPLVDAILNTQCQKIPLTVKSPFPDSSHMFAADNESVWQSMKQWLSPNMFEQKAPTTALKNSKQEPSTQRAAIFRFLRYNSPDADPVNRHWTTAYIMDDTTLYFFDCSLEHDGVYHVTRRNFVTSPQDIDEDNLYCIEPHSIRFLRAKDAD